MDGTRGRDAGPAGRYAGRSADERRAQRREQLRAAALEVIAEEGIGGLKVRALCARAGLNDRYFYEAYGHTDRLLYELVGEQLAEVVAAVMNAIVTAPADARIRLRAVVEAGVTAIADHPARRRLAIDMQTTDELRQRRTDLVGVVTEVMLDQGRELLGDAAVEGVHAELAARTVAHGGLEILVEWLRGELEIDRAQLIDFLVAMILTAAQITTTVQREMAAG
ncbi:TetR/AcrR family transcriptional regulator [Nocardia sp. CDC160]|uniref:TetR/AcrR family transcriptional regulator n=1 Tax=Nocardia sp. CDC160 TaxID=3112166 RepID=UPI002DBF4389|nr:TetR family transcriptional regulator [Nocardia sp. CDC160]MEC3920577.1 TetR family transcriptional regulator [Nocardia sp. CDC160]